MFVIGETLDLPNSRRDHLRPDDLLFLGRKKRTPLDPKKGWKGMVKRGGLPEDCTLHWLRKTCATRLLRAGVDIASVAKVTVTVHTVLLKHYASAGEARQREVVTQHAAFAACRHMGCSTGKSCSG
jgi:site-specific recombinase XerD